MEKTETAHGFLKNHADTLTIIGVNIALGAMLLSMILSQSHRIDAANTRSDAIMARIDAVQMIIFDMVKERK